MKDDIVKGIVNEDGEKNTTSYTFEDDLVVVSESMGACLHQDFTWIVDTSAMFYTTPNKSLFLSSKAGEYESVKIGNSSKSKIVVM